jgi:excisionase family DNA binding protein
MNATPLSGAESQERDAYTVRQLAARLGISTDSLRDAIDRGDIQVGRLGRRILIPVAEVKRILAPAQVSAA